jgi:phosphomannomutase / phosphoglucomutase
MNPSIFREYDIRGVADRDLDDALAADLGRAFAALVAERRGVARPRIAVGRDARPSSPRLFAAMCRGLRETADVIDVGLVPTPTLYFAAHHLATDGALVITGSHNPADENGFKLLIGTDAAYGADIATLRDRIAAHRAAGAAGAAAPPEFVTRGGAAGAAAPPEFVTRGGAAGAAAPPEFVTRGGRRDGAQVGGLEQVDVTPAYLAHVRASLRLGERRFKIVVDAGNGTGGPTATTLYQQLGFDVVPLYCDIDSRFPNHHPDPTVAANLADLIATVAREGAELGLALDGDSDRLGAVDGTGRILWGDQLMILLGKAILAEEPGASFIGEVKCSQAMYDELRAAGGQVEMWKVGHSLIKARMKETGAALGGEMSGHLFFAHRWLGFDDGIYAGARLLELCTRGDEPLAALAARLPRMVNTPELRLDCPDLVKFRVVARVTERMRGRPDVRGVIDVDGVRAAFDGGWGLVRASNTQPALVVRCEAATPDRLSEIRTIVEGEIAAARAEVAP